MMPIDTPNHRMNLSGQLLIAMPAMQDPYFSRSVVFVCTHDEDGAMGLIINQPLELNLGDLLTQLHLPCDEMHVQQREVFFGGPVQVERGFVLHSPACEFNTSMALTETLTLTSSKDILEAAACHQAPEHMLIALGYTGWAAGQLEQEIQDNAWLTLPLYVPDQLHTLLFKLDSDDKLPWAMQQLGVNFANLSEVAGHA